jgi:predicted translin family RNA/ssDNA-binding protein
MLVDDIIENKNRIKRLKEVTETLESLQYDMKTYDNLLECQYASKISKSIEVLKETQKFLENIYTDRITVDF